jgi:hypothetical protein
VVLLTKRVVLLTTPPVRDGEDDWAAAPALFRTSSAGGRRRRTSAMQQLPARQRPSLGAIACAADATLRGRRSAFASFAHNAAGRVAAELPAQLTHEASAALAQRAKPSAAMAALQRGGRRAVAPAVLVKCGMF